MCGVAYGFRDSAIPENLTGFQWDPDAFEKRYHSGCVLVGRAVGGRRYGNTITMSPPLVITRSECDRIVETLDRALSAVDFS